jgi:hypothetical protein
MTSLSVSGISYTYYSQFIHIIVHIITYRVILVNGKDRTMQDIVEMLVKFYEEHKK